MLDMKAKCIISQIILILLLSAALSPMEYISARESTAIYGRVIDANTGLPIPNATILIWDLNTLAPPRIGRGIYFTDDNGEYYVGAPYIKEGHTYYVFAYKGNLTEDPPKVEYVPSMVKNVYFKYSEKKNVSFTLLPAALIEVSDSPYVVQSPNPKTLSSTLKVIPKEKVNVTFVDEYGDAPSAWWMRLKRNIIIVPAGIPVVLEAKVWFFTGDARKPVDSKAFLIYNGSTPFLLHEGEKSSFSLSKTSLSADVDFLGSKMLIDVSNKIDEAQKIGFVVFDERRMLTKAYNKIAEARSLLERIRSPERYIDVWMKLREAYETLNFISATLSSKRVIAMSNAIYLPAVMAAFSMTLAFFLFEKEKRKIIASILIFILYSFLLYFIHPGAHIIVDKNLRVFLMSACASFLAAMLIVFGIPRVWKERTIEGRVSWRSALTIIFSMGKRQIRRRKIRGFFTILSITILILTFTSLTSFGTVFGIVSEGISGKPPSDGVIVKRMMNRTSLLFSPLGTSSSEDLSKIMEALSKLGEIEKVTFRLKNMPASKPIIRLVNPSNKRSWLIYGILAIDPENEAYYTDIEEAVRGEYLSRSDAQKILIDEGVAGILGVSTGDSVSVEILGTRVTANFTVKGLINGEKYNKLVDMDGGPYGPVRILEDGSVRVCNSTEVIIIPLKDAMRLQDLVNAKYPEKPPQVTVLSEIIFQPGKSVNINSMVEILIFIFNYDVFISQNGKITYYHIGSYLEMKGTIELLVPLVMVCLNVGAVMLNSVYERRKEIKILSMIGLNPTHIGLIFVAEAIILGMVGGSLGYIAGLGFYRIINLFGQNLMVREKLEWWWSAIGFALAIIASVLSAIRPAALAISTYTPSKIKRIKRSEEEMKAREEEIFRVYQSREMSMPLKVASGEILIFVSFFLDKLNSLKSGYVERVENIEEIPEIENVKGELVRRINFDYIISVPGKERRMKSSLILIKSPDEDYYRVRLVAEPAVPGLPETMMDRTVDFVHRILMDWARDRDMLVGKQ